jgi:uncharacterized protein (DUF3084 family)
MNEQRDSHLPLIDAGITEPIAIDYRDDFESTVNFLKAEIWSLNQELGRHTIDNDAMKNSLSIVEEANRQIKSENNSLKYELASREQESGIKDQIHDEFYRLQQQYQQLETQFSVFI